MPQHLPNMYHTNDRSKYRCRPIRPPPMYSQSKSTLNPYMDWFYAEKFRSSHPGHPQDSNPFDQNANQNTNQNVHGDPVPNPAPNPSTNPVSNSITPSRTTPKINNIKPTEQMNHRDDKSTNWSRSRIAEVFSTPFMTEQQLMAALRELHEERRRAMALTHKLQTQLMEQREYTRGLADLLRGVQSITNIKEERPGQRKLQFLNNLKIIGESEKQKKNSSPDTPSSRSHYVDKTEFENALQDEVIQVNQRTPHQRQVRSVKANVTFNGKREPRNPRGESQKAMPRPPRPPVPPPESLPEYSNYVYVPQGNFKNWNKENVTRERGEDRVRDEECGESSQPPTSQIGEVQLKVDDIDRRPRNHDKWTVKRRGYSTFLPMY